MKNEVLLTFALLLSLIMVPGLSAQDREPQLLTMAQLTPGNPDYLYAPALLSTYFDEQGEFHYTLPDDVASAHAVSDDPEEYRRDKVLESWYQTLTDTDPEAGGDSQDIVYGGSVHRNEFGIEKGIFWTADGSKFAFYRMDQSMVQSYPLVQTDAREAEVRWVKYPMAGMTSHQVTLGIYDPQTGETLYLRTNDKPGHLEGDSIEGPASLNQPEHYLTCVTWRPDGNQIFVAELNRLQNYMELNVYDAATGLFVETLFKVKAEKYVEPEHPLYFLPGSNDKFVWQDERDGWDHLYLYDLKAKRSVQVSDAFLHYEGLPSRQLTQGDWLVTDLLGADPKAKALYFMATKESPLESHLYCLDIKSGKLRRLTAECGVHRIKMSPDYTRFYDTFTNHDTPRVCQLVSVKDGSREVLYTAPNPYEGYARPDVEVGTLKAADGVTDLYYRLVKPLGYDSAKKYPTVVYLYNGPHAQLVTEGYQYGLPGWDCYMASRGYVVFTIDGRGSANRGLAFEQAIWRNLGESEGKDQMQGVAYLRTLPYVDPDRIGIYGWSYGGFMTTYMKLNYPETFKVGVCGGPVLDWSRYEVMYGERYMGTPQNNPEGYARNCMISQADKLQGRLLIIHDDQDATVVPQMSFQFLKNSVQAGTYPDFMIYPNHEHNVRGKDRVHLLTRIARYFDDFLK